MVFVDIDGCSNWDVVFAMADEKHTRDELNRRMAAVDEMDLATLIYTSGTTGVPKGVMLSHRNMSSNAYSAAKRLPVDNQAKGLSFLPLCHSYERVLVYVYMTAGVGVYYAESLETIGDNMREIHPHVFSAVPRLLEKVFDKIMAKGKALTGIKKAMFFWAVGLAKVYEHEGKGVFLQFPAQIGTQADFLQMERGLGR